MQEMEQPSQSAIHVAPLHISKDNSRAGSRSSDRPQTSSSTTYSASVPHQSGQMTPPLTPHDSEEARFSRYNDFQTYLRAFYPYYPCHEEGSTTKILPLNSGDIILVHSIHTNGWADGTLLISGERGWLPTNYCEGYDNDLVRNLLRALTVFWDLTKGSNHVSLDIFRNSDYVRGLIAGARCLLVSSGTRGFLRGLSSLRSGINCACIGKDPMPQQGLPTRSVSQCNSKKPKSLAL